MFCLSVFLLAVVVRLYKLFRDLKKEKLVRDRTTRDAMLRYLPQINAEEFRQVVERLGWVGKNELLGNYEMILPDSSFAPMCIIGLTFNSIINNWLSWDNLPANLELLAERLVDKYSGEELKDFLAGIPITENATIAGLTIGIEQARSKRESERNHDERDHIISAGLQASGIKLPGRFQRITKW